MDREEEEALALNCLVVLSRAHHAVMHEVKKNIETFDLYHSEFAVLELLYHKGEQPIQQIGKRILLTSGSITYVIDKLEKKAYLCRKRDPKDRRVIYAEITESGRELMQDIFPKHREAIHELFSTLNVEQQQSLAGMLKTLGLSLSD